MFEKFIPQRLTTKQPKITILPRGMLWLNFVTAKNFFEGFNRTVLLYDKERKVIGLRPSNEEKCSYCLSRSKDGKHRDIVVSAIAFLNHFKISHEKKRSYRPTWNQEEKLLEIDLTQPLHLTDF